MKAYPPRPLEELCEPGAGTSGYMLAGLSVIILFGGGIGVWAARTEIAGAVIAPATVVVETSVKKVQHPTGGIVGEIRVRDGDKVNAGELLIRLDETVARANRQLIARQFDELAARAARLESERDGRVDMSVPDSLARRMDDPAVTKVLDGERSLLASRNEVQRAEKAQLRERIAQLEEEIGGITAQIAAKAREIELIAEELAGLERLEAQQLVTTSKMVALRREAARLEGERGQLVAAAAQARGRIAEIELQVLRVDQEARTDAVAELRRTQAQQAELGERLIAADDQLMRVDIRAPQSGYVHELAVHTVGGVIGPGETIMLIVPEGDRLLLEARLAPEDIDQVLRAQSALVRFAAFNQRTTPELKGTIRRVSADLARDARTGEPYYIVYVDIPEGELARLEDKRLVPGMPAEVQIQTQVRTALSYFMKPFTDQVSRAFRER
jgi:HlyD family secretion protein